MITSPSRGNSKGRAVIPGRTPSMSTPDQCSCAANPSCQGNRSSVLGVLGLACVWLVWPAAVWAQGPKSPLEVKCERLYSVRSESPISLLIQLTPTGSGLLEGKLEIKLWNGNELLTTVTSEDEVISPPFKNVRYTLPAPELHGYAQQLDLTVDFLTNQGPIKSKPFAINVPLPTDRQMTIGMVAPETMRPTSEVEGLLNALKLEKYSPVPGDRSIQTISSRVYPDQLPAEAISDCAFNMLFIAAEGFAAVKESQWVPILEWVEAGGSLCVIPTDNLAPHHLAVLNQLLAKRASQGFFALSPQGELQLKNEEDRQPVYLVRRGLGRVAVVLLNPDQPFDSSSTDSRTAVAHLWRLRSDQAQSMVSNGKWNQRMLLMQASEVQSQNPALRYNYQNIRQDDRPLSYLPIDSGDQLVEAIVPSDLHIIPLSLIAFVLFLYVLAIGPGDYFILGRLNLRKWTWVTFPVTTLVFAGCALWMAEWYMNTGDARRSAYIVDIGIEGQPERVNQFEMLFNSRQKVTETPLTRSTFTALNHQMYGSGSLQNYRPQRVGSGSGFVGPAEFSGRFPTRYVARQLTPKWVPQLNRIMSWNVDQFPNKLDWQQFQIPDTADLEFLIQDPEWRSSLTDKLVAAFGHNVIVSVLHHGRQHQLYGNRAIFGRPAGQRMDGTNAGPAAPRRMGQYGLMPQYDFVSDISMLRDGGLFGVVSSIAPHGGRQLEDLSLLDPSDRRQWLLIVGIEAGENWIVYRKLYAGIE